MIFPLWLAFNLQAIIKLFFAGYFTYRWMKLFSHEEGPAIFAAIGAMFVSFNIVWLNHPQSNVSVLLPAAYYYTEKLARQPRWAHILGLLFTVFFQLLGGHMKTAFLSAVGTGLYFLVRIVLVSRQDPDARLSLRFWQFGWAYFLGTLLASFQVIPFLEFVSQSYTLSHLSDTPPDTLSLHYLILLLNPNLLGHPTAGVNWGDLNYNEGAMYTGLATIFILLLVLPARQLPDPEHQAVSQKRPLALALCGINVFLALLIFGPLAGLARHLPLFGLVDFSRLVMVFQLNIVLAAGLSLLLFLDRGKPAAHPVKVLGLSIAFIVSLMVVFDSPIQWKENPDYFFFHLAHFAIFLIAIILLFLGFHQSKFDRKKFSWGLCLILFLDLFLSHKDYNPVVDKKWLSHPHPPALEKIIDTPFRVTGLDIQLPPNTAMLAGFNDVSGFGNPIDGRTHRFFTTLFDHTHIGNGMRNIILLKTIREIKLLKLLNVKYIFSSREPRAENGETLPGLNKIYESGETRLYENQDVLPRAYVVSSYEKLNGEQILTKIRARPTQLKQTAFLEVDLPRSQHQALAANKIAPESSVRILSYEENRILIEASNNTPGILVLTDRYFPGWKVFVNGTPRSVYQTNYLFRGVFLDEGRHTVEFRYHPESVDWGFIISFLILAKIGVISFWRRKRED